MALEEAQRERRRRMGLDDPNRGVPDPVGGPGWDDLAKLGPEGVGLIVVAAIVGVALIAIGIFAGVMLATARVLGLT